jgi:hypothetical protein
MIRMAMYPHIIIKNANGYGHSPPHPAFIKPTLAGIKCISARDKKMPPANEFAMQLHFRLLLNASTLIGRQPERNPTMKIAGIEQILIDKMIHC